MENATAFMHLLSQSQATAIWKMISGGITEKDSKTQTKILVFVTQLKKLSQLYSPELFQQIVDRVNFDDLDQNKMILLLPLLQDLIPEEFEQNIDTLLDPKSNNIDITNYNWSLIRAITQKDWESYAIKELPQVGQQLLDALKKELDKTKEVEKVIGLIKKIFFDYSDSYILAVNPLIEILFFVRRHNRLPIDESQIAFHRWAVNPQSYMKKLPFYASILRCSLLQKEAVNPTLERHRRHGYDTYHLIYNSFNSDGWIASVSDYGHSYQLPTSKNDLVRLLSSIYRHKNLSHIFDYYELNYFSNKGNDENGEWVSVTIARLVLALKAQKFSFLKESSHFIKPHQIDEGILNEWLDMLDIAPDHVRNNAELQAFLNESSLNYDTRAADSLSAFKNLLNSLMANDKEASTASLQCFTKNTHSHLKLLFSALTQNTINRILIENKELFLLFLEFRNNTYSVGGRDYTSCEFLDKLAEQLPLNLSQNVAYLEAILDYSIKRSKSEINRSEIGNDYSIIYELRDLTKNAGWGVGGGSWFSSQMNGRMMFFPGLLIEAMRKFHSDKPYTGFFQVANTISTLSLETLQTQLPQIEGVIRSNDNQDDALNAIQSMKALTAGSATPNEASLERLDFPQEPAGIPTAANNNNQPHNNNVTPHSPVEAPLKAPINQAQIPLKFILSELFNDKLVESKFAHTEQTLKKFFSDKLKNLNQSLSICKDWYKRENIKKDINVVKSMEALTLPAIKELQRIWRTEADPKKRANKLMQLEIKLIRQSAKSNVNKCIALSIIAAALLIGAIVATIFTCGAFGLIAGFSIALSAALSTALASTSAAAGVVGILCIPAAFFQNNQANSKDQAALERNWLIPTASR